MDYLKDCPFCTSEDIYVELREDGFRLRDPERLHPSRYLAYSAICRACGARGPLVKVDEGISSASRYFAVETAAALWNGEIPPQAT